MTVETDKTVPAYWTTLKKGQLVQLSDEQTISYLMGQGYKNITHGADFEVQRKRSVTSQDGKIKWWIFDITLDNFTWYLVVKILSSDEIETKVYYIPDDFKDGDRNDMFENDQGWLFEEPDKPHNTLAKDLQFVQEIIEGQEPDQIVYKAIGCTYGVCVDQSDETKDFSTVIEYHTSKEGVENPDLLILELNAISGWSERDVEEDEWGDVTITITEGVDVNEETSYICLFQGCSVRPSDISILR